jgi:hypothetical protein
MLVLPFKGEFIVCLDADIIFVMSIETIDEMVKMILWLLYLVIRTFFRDM